MMMDEESVQETEGGASDAVWTPEGHSFTFRSNDGADQKMSNAIETSAMLSSKPHVTSDEATNKEVCNVPSGEDLK